MIKILSPESFKSIPWKNGKGTTTELAINPGGTLVQFDWRLSIASVIEDGEFSDFSGYQRNLILIEGSGIDLQHDNHLSDKGKVSKLSECLSYATFDGGSRTIGSLHNGPIRDFNIMTRTDIFEAQVDTWTTKTQQSFLLQDLNFIYSLSAEAQITLEEESSATNLPEGYLAFIDKLSSKPKSTQQLMIAGENIIFVRLKKLSPGTCFPNNSKEEPTLESR
ncbi:HutD family protein [Aliikangiella sp. G2MR2-5]|uniref:HutD/Ves family protein n=1 Tax=Aliikangiella sp. G2MR2-5 TaxID=2788943 RepID=UPI0018AB8985|nr:HutD family protein [Aliikangiella sp. G2MR2-5]